jgi:hypothetical protein
MTANTAASATVIRKGRNTRKASKVDPPSKIRRKYVRSFEFSIYVSISVLERVSRCTGPPNGDRCRVWWILRIFRSTKQQIRLIVQERMPTIPLMRDLLEGIATVQSATEMTGTE